MEYGGDDEPIYLQPYRQKIYKKQRYHERLKKALVCQIIKKLEEHTIDEEMKPFIESIDTVYDPYTVQFEDESKSNANGGGNAAGDAAQAPPIDPA